MSKPRPARSNITVKASFLKTESSFIHYFSKLSPPPKDLNDTSIVGVNSIPEVPGPLCVDAFAYNLDSGNVS